jgi:hypothetical protein
MTVPSSPRSSSESIAEPCWPIDFLPQDVPNARIITYGYDSHITKFYQGATNQNPFYQHAEDMLFGLGDLRDSCTVSHLAIAFLFLFYLPIMFIRLSQMYD